MKSAFNALYPFRHASSGRLLLNRHDIYVRGAVERYGEFSEAEVDLWRDLLTPDDLVVEVGANMGAHTLALAGLASHVYAFEPQRFMFQTLCANLGLNSIDNVIPRQAAVGPQDGSICVPCLDPRTEQNFGSFSFRKPYESGDYVPCLALDSLVWPRLNLLKLDCEGSEASVLMGARETIMLHRPFIYLEFGENRQLLLQMLDAMGYCVGRHLPTINREPNFAGVSLTEDDARLASDMVLAIPRERKPNERLIPPFGQRHGFFIAKDEELLGRPATIEWMEFYQPKESACPQDQ